MSLMKAEDKYGSRAFDYVEKRDPSILYFLEMKGICVHLINEESLGKKKHSRQSSIVN